MPTKQELDMLCALPLDVKIAKSQQRIREWIDYWGEDGVYVSFSGGKDSTALLHLVREVNPNIKAVFFNTGLELPQIQRFVRETENVDIIQPTISFIDVIKQYGYPIFSKEISDAIYFARRPECEKSSVAKYNQLIGQSFDKNGNKSKRTKERWFPAYLELPFNISGHCCTRLKKLPSKSYMRKYHRRPIIGTMTEESSLRVSAYLKSGCNSFDGDYARSVPLSFWNESDVLQYISLNKIPYCDVYGEIVCENDKYKCLGCQRTGCSYCGFGLGLVKNNNRFIELKKLAPKQYDFSLSGGEFVENPHYDPLLTDKNRWNPKQIWQPNKDGLGMAKIFDMVNDIYGKNFIIYQ